MTYRSYPDPYFRDPRREQDAIAALANIGRPAAGPDEPTRQAALSALALAGRSPEQIARDRATAASALLQSAPVPEPLEPELGPDELQALEQASASALARTGAASRPSPDDIAREESTRLDSAQALAKTGEALKPPPRDAAREEAERLGSARALAKSGRDLMPPEPDVEKEEAERSRAAGALAQTGRDQTSPEPDRELERTRAAGALAQTGRDQAPPEPDRELERAGEATAFKALAKTGRDLETRNTSSSDNERAATANAANTLAQRGRDNAPPPPREDPPIPVGMTRRVVRPTSTGVEIESTTVKRTPEAEPADAEARSLTERVREASANDPAGSLLGIGGSSASGAEESPPGVNGWALAADLILNRGRGIGGIIGQAEQQKQAWLKQRDARSKGASADALRQAELDIQRGNLDARNKEIETQRRALDVREGKGKATLQGVFGAPPPEPEEKPKSFEVDEVVTADLPDQPSPEEVERVEDFVSPGGEGTSGETASQKLAREKFEYQKERNKKKDEAAGGDGKTAAQTRLERRDAATDARAYNKDTEYQRKIAQQIDAIDTLVSKYEAENKELPGQGVVAGRVPNVVRGVAAELGYDTADNEAAIAINNAKTRLQEYALREDTGAAAPESEQLRAAVANGTRAGATLTEFRAGLNAARKLAQNDLRSLSIGREESARKVLAAAKLDHWLDDADAESVTPVPDGQTKPVGAASTGSSRDNGPKTIDEMRQLTPEAHESTTAVEDPLEKWRKKGVLK